MKLSCHLGTQPVSAKQKWSGISTTSHITNMETEIYMIAQKKKKNRFLNRLLNKS